MGQNIERTIVQQGIESLGRYYSIYRAIVVRRDDPFGLCRLKVSIFGLGNLCTQLWAFPKGQYGTNNAGFKTLTPQVGDVVWITFENGDPSLPVWEHHGWSKGQVPLDLNQPDVHGFKTNNGTEVIFNDKTGSLDIVLPGDNNKLVNGIIHIYGKGEITLESEAKLNILATGDVNINSDGNTNIISDGNINIEGDKVSVNGGDNEGTVVIAKLTAKLNRLVSELEQYKAMFNAHVHISATPGSPTTSPTTSYSTAFSTFNQSDYEDTKFVH